MIKITSPIVQQSWCHTCGVKFSFDITDTRLGIQMGVNRNIYEAPYVFCPVCKKAVYVKIK